MPIATIALLRCEKLGAAPLSTLQAAAIEEPEEKKMKQALRTRFDAMFGRDKMMAWVFVILLWVTIAFVYFAIDQFVTDTTLRAAISIGAFLLLVFNTAAILAMVRHYGEDKAHLYGLDVGHLDESR